MRGQTPLHSSVMKQSVSVPRNFKMPSSYFDIGWISNSRHVRSLLNILQNGGFSTALETHLRLELLVSVNSDNVAFILSLDSGNRNKKMETQTFLGKPRGLEFLLL